MANSGIKSTQIVPVPSNNAVTIDNNNMITIKRQTQWSQSVLMFICDKGKDDYLTGAIDKPGEEESGYIVWKIENNMVMSWLINSMTNEIGENFLLYNSA